jgi:signal transduction histidine kinase
MDDRKAHGGPSSEALALLERAAHDLRGPLHALLGLCDLLSGGVYDPLSPRQQEAVTRLCAEAQRLAAMGEDVTELVRLSNGSLEIEPQEIDLRALLGAVARSHDIVVEGPAAPARFRQDGARIERALRKIIAFAAEQSRATLRVRSVAPRVEIEVGPFRAHGLPEEDPRAPLPPAQARVLLQALGGDLRVEDSLYVVSFGELAGP